MIVPVVEGQSEVLAVAGLMRRVLYEDGVFDLPIARPFRVKRQKVVRPGELERAIVQAQRSRTGATALFVLLDADDDCPAELGPSWRERGEGHTDLPVRVVLTKVEIECWMLAAIDDLPAFAEAFDLSAAEDRSPSFAKFVRDLKGLTEQSLI